MSTHDILYIINGDPVALARAKIGGRYAKRHMYDSQSTQKLVTGITLRNQHGDLPPYQGPLYLNVTFYIAIPPKNIRKFKPLQYHSSPSDLDNLIKYICDTCQSVDIFKNDCQIAKIDAVKYYDWQPRTEFYIKELK